MSKSVLVYHTGLALIIDMLSDYDVFMSPLSDFKAEMVKAGLEHKAVYLDRGEEFTFKVRGADKI